MKRRSAYQLQKIHAYLERRHQRVAFMRWLRSEYASIPIRWRDDTRPYTYRVIRSEYEGFLRLLRGEDTGEPVSQEKVLTPSDYLDEIEQFIARAGGIGHVQVT